MEIKKLALEKAINESIDDMHVWGNGSRDAFAIYQDNRVQVQVIVTNDPSEFMDQLYQQYVNAEEK